ncbi:MAG: hypothetical protein ACO2PN_29245 [Pyrobaculum sp.]
MLVWVSESVWEVVASSRNSIQADKTRRNAHPPFYILTRQYIRYQAGIALASVWV